MLHFRIIVMKSVLFMCAATEMRSESEADSLRHH